MSYDSIKLDKLEQLAQDTSVTNLKIKDIMETSFPMIKESYSVKSCIEILRVHKISAAPVVSDSETLLGYVSEYDLLIQVSTAPAANRVKFKKDVITLYEDQKIKDALELIIKKKLKLLPVIDKRNRVLGLLTRISLLNALVQYE